MTQLDRRIAGISLFLFVVCAAIAVWLAAGIR